MHRKFNEITSKYFLWVKDDPQKIWKFLNKYWLNWSVSSKNGQNLRKFSTPTLSPHISKNKGAKSEIQIVSNRTILKDYF